MTTRSDALVDYITSLGHTYLNPNTWQASIVEYGKFTQASKPYIKVELTPKQTSLMIKVSVIIEKDYNEFITSFTM